MVCVEEGREEERGEGEGVWWATKPPRPSILSSLPPSLPPSTPTTHTQTTHTHRRHIQASMEVVNALRVPCLRRREPSLSISSASPHTCLSQRRPSSSWPPSLLRALPLPPSLIMYHSHSVLSKFVLIRVVKTERRQGREAGGQAMDGQQRFQQTLSLPPPLTSDERRKPDTTQRVIHLLLTPHYHHHQALTLFVTTHT